MRIIEQWMVCVSLRPHCTDVHAMEGPTQRPTAVKDVLDKIAVKCEVHEVTHDGGACNQLVLARTRAAFVAGLHCGKQGCHEAGCGADHMRV